MIECYKFSAIWLHRWSTSREQTYKMRKEEEMEPRKKNMVSHEYIHSAKHTEKCTLGASYITTTHVEYKFNTKLRLYLSLVPDSITIELTFGPLSVYVVCRRKQKRKKQNNRKGDENSEVRNCWISWASLVSTVRCIGTMDGPICDQQNRIFRYGFETHRIRL